MVEIDTASMFDLKTMGGVALIVVGGGLLITSYRNFQSKLYWRMVGMGVVGVALLYGGVQVFKGKTETAKKEVKEEVKEKIITAIEEVGETEEKEAQSGKCICGVNCVCECGCAESGVCNCGPSCPCDCGCGVESTEAETYEAEFTERQRTKLAKKGFALPDGSFPIRNKNDLENAIKLWGFAKNKAIAKKFIKKRAKQLNALNTLPASW